MIRQTISRALAPLLLALGATPTGAQVLPTEATTMIVAARAASGGSINGPALAEQGRAQAGSLASAMAHASVAAVYSADDRTSLETARIVADELGVELRPYDFDPHHADYAAGHLLANLLPANAGRAVLVVIPRDVIAPFLRRAAGVDQDEIGRVRSDELFVVTVAPGYASVVRARIPDSPSDRAAR